MSDAAKKKSAGPMIGSTACYVCNDRVPVKEQANGLAMVNCGWCGCQLYARGELADKKIRERMTPIEKPAGAVAPVLTPKKEAAPAAASAAKTSAKKSGSLLEEI